MRGGTIPFPRGAEDPPGSCRHAWGQVRGQEEVSHVPHPGRQCGAGGMRCSAPRQTELAHLVPFSPTVPSHCSAPLRYPVCKIHRFAQKHSRGAFGQRLQEHASFCQLRCDGRAVSEAVRDVDEVLLLLIRSC